MLQGLAGAAGRRTAPASDFLSIARHTRRCLLDASISLRRLITLLRQEAADAMNFRLSRFERPLLIGISTSHARALWLAAITPDD